MLSTSSSRKRNRASKRFTSRKRARFDARRGLAKRLPLTGFPKSQMVRLRYCQEISLNAGVAGIAVNVFRANDLYDPDVTGSGHQPMGFDQWIPTIYNHFTVVGSKITVTYTPTTSASTTPAYMGILMSDGGDSVSTVANVNELMEQKLLTRSRGTVGFSYHLVNNASAQVHKTFSAKKFFGKKNIVGDSLYRGNSTASPTEQAYFEVFCASVGNNDPGIIGALVTIDYIAVLTEPQTFASS